MDKVMKQEMFNKAVVGLRGQRWVRCHENGACLYRGPEGRKCAIGHLIPDERYEPWMDGRGPAGEATGDFGEILRKGLGVEMGSDDRCWFSDLQSRHDGAVGIDDMEQRFRVFAQVEGLTFPEAP